MLDYGLSNATFETPNYIFALEVDKPNLNLVIRQLNKKDTKFQHQTQIYFPGLSKKKKNNKFLSNRKMCMFIITQ
jgi:hypothetical protein